MNPADRVRRIIARHQKKSNETDYPYDFIHNNFTWVNEGDTDEYPGVFSDLLKKFGLEVMTVETSGGEWVGVFKAGEKMPPEGDYSDEWEAAETKEMGTPEDRIMDNVEWAARDYQKGKDYRAGGKPAYMPRKPIEDYTRDEWDATWNHASGSLAYYDGYMGEPFPKKEFEERTKNYLRQWYPDLDFKQEWFEKAYKKHGL